MFGFKTLFCVFVLLQILQIKSRYVECLSDNCLYQMMGLQYFPFLTKNIDFPT